MYNGFHRRPCLDYKYHMKRTISQNVRRCPFAFFQAIPAVAHLYAHDGLSTSVTGAGRALDPPSAVATNTRADVAPSPAALELTRPSSVEFARPSSIIEGDETSSDEEGAAEGEKEGGEVSRDVAAVGDGGVGGGDKERERERAAEAAAGQLLAATAKERQSVMRMSNVVLQEAKRNKRFRFFSEER